MQSDFFLSCSPEWWWGEVEALAFTGASPYDCLPSIPDFLQPRVPPTSRAHLGRTADQRVASGGGQLPGDPEEEETHLGHVLCPL